MADTSAQAGRRSHTAEQAGLQYIMPWGLLGGTLKRSGDPRDALAAAGHPPRHVWSVPGVPEDDLGAPRGVPRELLGDPGGRLGISWKAHASPEGVLRNFPEFSGKARGL